MYVPIIPSVTTSVIDRSTIDVVINGKRTILLPIFSKYGKEGFSKFSSINGFNYSMGQQDIKKYGNAYLYGEAACITDNVITYRMLPDDATYANNTIRANGLLQSYPNIITKNDMTYIDTKSKVDNDVVISALARNRGEGYNSILVTFNPATEFEKNDSNNVGETNYKFNFIQADIYEKTSNGNLKALGDPVVFSLIETDNVTNDSIIDKISGENLFVNDIFKDSNEFLTLNIDPKYSDEINDNATIDDVAEFRFIIEDDLTPDKNYELKVETYNKIVVDSNGINQRIPTQRLTAVITSDFPALDDKGSVKYTPIIKYVDDNGDDNGKLITITNSKITLSNAPSVSASTPISFKLDGEDAFYDFSLDVLGEIVFTEIYTLRHMIYSKLMEYSVTLYAGYDGKNLHINNRFNLNGESEPEKQNGKELLLQFFNNTEDLREVLYPKYDFDYIPDWSENVDVQVAIINLADDIGLTMPILSLPLSYNPTITKKDLPERDLETRKEKLFQSSYNSTMYSGQLNKTHKTNTNLKLYMPLSYYSMIAHLRIDNQFSITEPVANIVKGTLASTNLNLTYAPTSLEIESLRNSQINTVIVEPDGTYIIDQLTMYKKASKLSRSNVVKVLHRIRKDLPKLLKDLLQKKAIGSVIDLAVGRTEKELSKWIITPENAKDGIFETGSVKATFNEKTNKLRLTITVKPVGTLESIDIPIIVV